MKVLTYNVLWGGEGRLDAIAAVIAGEEPDVVALLEARADATGELSGMLGMESVLAESNGSYARALGIGVAWLSRVPIERAEDHRLPELSKALLEIQVDGVRLYATHLASRHETTDHPREVELRAIVDVLRDGGEALLVGDLNSLARGDPIGEPPAGWVPRGDAMPGASREALVPLAEAGYVDCYRAAHPDVPGFTFPAAAPWLRLDYVFASPTIAPRLRDCEVVRTDLAQRASDHLPLRAQFD